MAHDVFKIKDASALLNAIAKDALGMTTNQVHALGDFVSVGESVLATGTEQVLKSIATVLGKRIIGVRPYTAKLTLFEEEDTGLYTSRIEKTKFLARWSKESGWVNTDLYEGNIGIDGRDNTANNTVGSKALGTMWEQEVPVTISYNFGGSSVWEFELTVYPDQLKAAFRNEAEFVAFFNGMLQEKRNEIERIKEAYNRMVLLNYIAGLYYLSTTPQTDGGTDYLVPGGSVNLVKEYNAKYGYTGDNKKTVADLLGPQYIDDFMKFLAGFITKLSDHMEEESTEYHLDVYKTIGDNTFKLINHTPKSEQRLMLFKDIMTDAKTMVFPTIFNPEYLDIKNYEGIDFWQSRNDRMHVKVKPAVPTLSSGVLGTQTTTANAVDVPYVVGVLFDKEAIKTNFQFDGADVSPMEARKRYQNTWYHNMKNSMVDYCENGCLLYMADET